MTLLYNAFLLTQSPLNKYSTLYWVTDWIVCHKKPIFLLTVLLLLLKWGSMLVVISNSDQRMARKRTTWTQSHWSLSYPSIFLFHFTNPQSRGLILVLMPQPCLLQLKAFNSFQAQEKKWCSATQCELKQAKLQHLQYIYFLCLKLKSLHANKCFVVSCHTKMSQTPGKIRALPLPSVLKQLSHSLPML